MPPLVTVARTSNHGSPEETAHVDLRVQRPLRRQHGTGYARRNEARSREIQAAWLFARDQRRTQGREDRIGVVQHQRRRRAEIDDGKHEAEIQPGRTEQRKEKDPREITARSFQLLRMAEAQPRSKRSDDDHHAGENGRGDRHARAADQFRGQRGQPPAQTGRAGQQNAFQRTTHGRGKISFSKRRREERFTPNGRVRTRLSFF